MAPLLKRIGQASVGALLLGSAAGCAGGGQRVGGAGGQQPGVAGAGADEDDSAGLLA